MTARAVSTGCPQCTVALRSEVRSMRETLRPWHGPCTHNGDTPAHSSLHGASQHWTKQSYQDPCHKECVGQRDRVNLQLLGFEV